MAELEKVAPERKLKINQQLSNDLINKNLIERLNSIKSITSKKSNISGESEISQNNNNDKGSQKKINDNFDVAVKSRIIEKENIETGKVKIEIYLKYIRAIGYFICFIFLIIYVLSSILGVLSNLWLADWSDHAAKIQSNVNNTFETHKRLIIYTSLGMGQGFN